MDIKKAISIVVPTYNEEGNVSALITRISSVLIGKNIEFEVIIVDDNSTDLTQSLVEQLSRDYPVNLVVKSREIKKGKAESLMIGFKKAKYDLIAMIDADLQYSPETIPSMVDKIVDGADIVVANRIDARESGVRKLSTRVFRFIFAKTLHSLYCDVQSGLKVFKKEIIERIKINPTNWTFDLEFLVLGKDAGYIIETVPMEFAERLSGVSNINVIRDAYIIASNALKLKFKGHQVIHLHPDRIVEEGQGFHYKGTKYVFHSQLHHSESALVTLTGAQKIVLLSILLLIVLGLVFSWHATIVIAIAGLTTLYFCDLFFNLYLIYRSFAKSPEIKISEDEVSMYPDSFWPKYTIFCPLYKEWEVLPQFVSAMSQLEYPQDKLQIMLLLEENDPETVQKAQEFNLPSNFDIVVVPHSKPKTKPKACNYGLLKATGEYIVIYDAEDIPDKLQLKKAVLAFNQSAVNVKCVQAKLNYYNPHQNILTRLFTAEYSLWFDLVLTGLQSINALIPLGGTSNHFKTRDLRLMNGWDGFNVTEDCDLGIRLVQRGFVTALLDSTTLEEANSDYMNWLHQRSRWIKGYMVSYFVHMRNPKIFFTKANFRHFIALQFNVGGKILSLFINPLMWAITIGYFAARTTFGPIVESFFPPVVFYMAVVCLVCGNFLYTFYYMIGCAKREHYEIIKYIYLVPIYWLWMSVAAWYALYKLIVAPHHWAKTKHGLHLQNKKSVEQSQNNIGRNLIEDNIVRSGVQA